MPRQERKSLTFGSLFAGIGGFDLGFERAGMICRWQVEIDDYANRVLAKHWPNVRRWPDVRTWPQSDTEWVDVICGGFPCQDISHAGKRAGITGERSGLFYEAVRVVAKLRPRFVVLENVAALLDRGMDAVLAALASIGLDAEWGCIPACSFGAPHIRDRVFILAYPSLCGAEIVSAGQRPEGTGAVDAAWARQIAPLRDSRDAERWRLESGVLRQSDPPPKIAPAGRGTSLGTYLGKAWATEPGEDWLDDGISGELAESLSRLAGNAVVPQVTEWIGRRIVEAASET